MGIAKLLPLIAVDVTFRNRLVTVATFYRSPSQSVAQRDSYLSDLQDFLASLGQRIHNLLLSGDFNFCALDQDDYSPLANAVSAFPLTQIVSEPTHRKRTLDLVFIGSCLSLVNWGLAAPVEKHHCLVWMQLEGLSRRKANEHRIMVWDWDNADWNRARFLLAYNSNGTPRNLVTEVLSKRSVSDCVSYLNKVLLDLLNLCVPHALRKVLPEPVPWFNGRIKRLIARRNGAFTTARRTNDSHYWAKFRALRKEVKRTVYLSKRNHYTEVFQQVHNSGQFWRAFRKCSGSHTAEIPPLRRPNGTYAATPREKAQLLAETFAANWTVLDSPPLTFPVDPDIRSEWQCTSDFVCTEINKLPMSSPTGLDNIPIQLLKACGPELAETIAAIVNRSLAVGQFPVQWKEARITALQKVSSSSEPNDFRPISILPLLSKCAERWLMGLIAPHVKFSPNQFAYLPGRSTEDALAFLQASVADGFELCHGTVSKVAAVSVDIAKAFDSIPTHALITQMQKSWNIPSAVLRLLKDYLADRKQLIRVPAGGESEKMEVKSGVPQGSILGGFLFAAYVNSILNLRLSPNTITIMYADDLLLLKPITSAFAEQELQQDLDRLQIAYSDLFLRINPSKSKLLVFSLANIPPALTRTFKLDGVEIPRVDALTYLGFVLDRRLNFHANTSRAVAKGKRALGALYRSFGRIAGNSVLSRLICTKIMPIFLYGLPVILPSAQKSVHELEKLNRFAARLCLNDYVSTYGELLEKLDWKSVARVGFERRAMLAFKYVYSVRHLPGSSITMQINPFRHSARISENKNVHELQILIPSFTRKGPEQFPIFNVFRTWNVLPQSTVLLPDFGSFRSDIRSPVIYCTAVSRAPDVTCVLYDL